MRVQNVCFNTGQMYEGRLYCSSSIFNGLLEINIQTGESRFVQAFPNEKEIEIILHRDSFLYKDKIGFVPQSAKGVSVYEPMTNTLKYIDTEIDGKHYVMTKCVVNNILWLFPVGTADIMTINLDTYERKVFSKFFNDENMRIQRALYMDEKIWLANIGGNTIVELNPSNLKVEKHILDVDGIDSISEGKSGIWIIANNNGSVFLWNYKNSRLEKYIVESSIVGAKYIDIIETSEEALLMPMDLTTIMRKKEADVTFKEWYCFKNNVGVYKKSIAPFWISSLPIKNGYLFFPCNVDKLIMLDDLTKEMHFINLTFSETMDFFTDSYKQMMIDKPVNEGFELNIEEFIEIVVLEDRVS